MGRYFLLYEKGNGNARAAFGGAGAKRKGSKGSEGSKGSKGGGGGFAAIYSRRYGIFFPPDTRHPERKRRISVRIAGDKIVSKYRSAGRLPFGSQVCVECLFDLQRSTPLRHFVALSAPVGSVSLDSQSSADSLRIQFPCHLKGAQGALRNLPLLLQCRVTNR